MTDARADILFAVRAAQAQELPLPDLTKFAPSSAASLDEFTSMLEFIGARWVRGASITDLIAWVEANIPAGATVVSTSPGLRGNLDLASITDPHDLDGIHTAVLPGRFGVCENGAVWLDESALGPHRVLPFIAEHLVLVVHAADLVSNMHAAYARLEAPPGGFGVFVAGPSKTADIEQCLVVGAHGARSCTVFVLD
jgi:L-lactate dehydrogenase complex protein LldG